MRHLSAAGLHSPMVGTALKSKAALGGNQDAAIPASVQPTRPAART